MNQLVDCGTNFDLFLVCYNILGSKWLNCGIFLDVCDLPCPVPFKLDNICRAIVLYMLIFQEVLDLNPQGVIPMLQGDYMMVFIPVESENHHVTTHIPHEIMTVVTHWLQVLTVGKEAWKIALTGRNLCSFEFHVVRNVYLSVLVHGRRTIFGSLLKYLL